jgi:hypothetical protein
MDTPDLILTIISMIGGSVVIGVSAAFSWFKATKSRMYDRLEKMEKDMMANAEKHTGWHLDNSRKLYGLEIHQQNTEDALKEIRDLSHKTSRTIERLLQALVSRGVSQNGDNNEG